MGNLWRSLTGALAAAAMTGCATAAPEAPTARPALWRVADADTIIYLFGTIHALPEGTEWRSAALDRALAAADTLVLETRIDGDPMELAGVMLRLGTSEGLPPLAERVPADKRAALAAAIEHAGIPAPVLDRLETWAAGFAILAASLRKMGLEGERGVELTLLPDFKNAGKTVETLETVDQQLGLFDGLSEEAQRAFLVSTIDDEAQAKGEFRAMLAAWKAGDIDAIAATFDGETALSPELRRALMTNRNDAWAKWVDARMERPGTLIVAVGAGHLAGTDSVQNMLEARGVHVERVQ